MHAPQRQSWTGDPERLPDGFTLTYLLLFVEQ
jgi:hypothetical protein